MIICADSVGIRLLTAKAYLYGCNNLRGKNTYGKNGGRRFNRGIGEAGGRGRGGL